MGVITLFPYQYVTCLSVPADLQSAGLELGICNPLCVTDFHVASFLLAIDMVFLEILMVFRWVGNMRMMV